MANRTRGLWIQQALPEEIWKPIPRFETLYEVSSMGRVRTLVSRKNMPAGSLLSTKPHKKSGYCYATLRNDEGIRKHHFVHRLMMKAFYPIANPKAFDVNHIDGIKSRNVLSNLEWCSHHINMIHYTKVLKPARDLQKIDTRTNVEKLTKAEIGFIQRLMAEQFPIAKIAAMFCVSESDLSIFAQVA